MANKKITELPAATVPLNAGDILEIVQGGVNKQVAKSDVATGGGGGTVTSVSGTANQIASTGGATPVLSLVNDTALPGAPTAATAAQGTNTTQIATTAFVNAEIAADAPRGLPMVAATGAVISFAIPQYYGSASAITGNITFSTTGAILGMEQVMRHNSATEPTLSVEFKKMEGSRNYVTNVDNFLYCKYLSATKIQYTWNQEQ